MVSQSALDVDKALDMVGGRDEAVDVEFESGTYEVTVPKGYGRRVPNPAWPGDGPRYHWEGVPVLRRRVYADRDGHFVRYRKAKWSVSAHSRIHESGTRSVGFEARPR